MSPKGLQDEAHDPEMSASDGKPLKRSLSPSVQATLLSMPVRFLNNPDETKHVPDYPDTKRQRMTEPNRDPLQDEVVSDVVEIEDSPVSDMTVKKHEPRTAEEAQAAMLALSNPKAEIKQEDRILSDEEALTRLEVAGLEPYPISTDEAIRNVTVTRKFIGKRFGGPLRDTFPRPSEEKLAQHGYDNLMCINLSYAPYAPQKPGYPGLMFSMSPAQDPWSRERPHTMVLFVRLRTNEWLYCGLYEQTAAPSLMAEQWQAQTADVRKNWSQEIHAKVWGKRIRVSIGLRRQLGRDATKEEIHAGAESADDYKHITPQDILTAYDHGDEVMGVWSMKCVGYDEQFQLDLIKGRRQGRAR